MDTGEGNESSSLGDLTGLNDPASMAAFIELAFDAVIGLDPQERITSWNPAAEQIFGWIGEEALGRTPDELFWPAYAPLEQEKKEQRQASLKRGETLTGRLTACRKDGSTFPAQFTARAIFNAEGMLLGYLSVYRDISAQVQAREKEKELERSNQKLNEILTSIQDDFYVLDHNWVFVFASRSFTSRIGKEPKDFVGNNIWEMFPKHVGGTLYENFHNAIEKREVRRFEIPGRYTDAWYRMTAFPSEEGITVIGTDITEHKKTEDALRQSQKTFQELIERAPFGVYVVDSQFRISHMNASSQTGAFRNVRPVIGHDFAEAMRILWPEEIASGIISAFRHTLETGEPYFSPRFTNPRQDVAAVESYEWELQRMTLPDGQYGVICYYYDSTKLREAEKAVRESEKQLQLLNESLEQKVREKTEAIQRLASDLTKAVQRERHRISHILHDDLQQHIYAIQMQMTFLRYELQKGNERAYWETSEVDKQLGEVLEITRNLSIDLSPPILRDEGLSHAIRWLAGQMRQRYGLTIEVQAEEPFAIPDEELHVLLFNCVRELLFNIVKHAEASRAVVSLCWSDINLQIEVYDDGKGFPPDLPRQIASVETAGEDGFQPSFGLPTIRQQLSLFGGYMDIQSKPEGGTQITLIAPVAKSA